VWRNAKLRRQSRLTPAPIPPARLIFSSTGTRDVSWFLQSGAETASVIRDALSSVGHPLEALGAVFELGCGTGRVLRQWADVKGPKFFASDYNPAVVKWVRQNLPRVSAAVNQLVPPLEYADASFDFVYAISVFTHLPLELQMPWLQELHRVLKPNGLLLVTLSGEGDLMRTTPQEQARFGRGELVVVDPKYAGTNLCGVYHPESYVRTEWSRLFSVLRFLPQGAKGSPFQDLYLLQRV